ncbi:MAG: hypothetical protein IT578_01455 [Verrucomicrobiae bacterium]|nr:hypothetical protein [Verrucomicrobiae bacterium]
MMRPRKRGLERPPASELRSAGGAHFSFARRRARSPTGFLLPVLALVFALPFANAVEPLARWRFDDSLEGMGAAGEIKPIEGRGGLVAQGREGKAVEPGQDGLVYALPEAAAAAGALSFWYREPPREKPPKNVAYPPLPIVRLGKSTLFFDRERYIWRGEKEGDEEPLERLHAVRSENQSWRLLELSWNATEARVFMNGRLVSICRKPVAAPVTPLTFALLNGDFDEMELGKKAADAGARYEGVIYAENFEGDGPPKGWIRCALGGKVEASEKVPGAIGSRWAFGMLKPMVKPSLFVNLVGIVLTEDTAICVLLRSALPKASLVVTTATNHWLTRLIEPETWTAVRVFPKDFQANPGEILSGFAFNNPSEEEMALALDNFAVIRGEKSSRPTAPEGLKAEAQSGAVKLSWSAATDEGGVAGYRIYRGDRADFLADDKHEIGRTLEAEFADDGVKGGGSRHYKVSAEDHLGQLGPAASAVVSP